VDASRERQLVIPFGEALSIVESQGGRLDSEQVPLAEAAGRYLVTDLRSSIDNPPFTKAAMDGYALRANDRAPELRILETIAAGSVPTQEIRPGTCSRIMTGAVLPEGADKVHRVEYAEERNGHMLPTRAEPSANIIRKGENLTAGEPALGPRRLFPQDVGVIASLGIPSVEVMRTPRIAILATGSELSEPGEPVTAGGIYNSNAYQLSAHAREAGCEATYYGIVEDTQEALEEVLSRAFSDADIVILTGGVSKGQFDYVPAALEANGVEVLFHRVAMKPGRPTLFGRRASRYVFGLPGNPVSAFVTFEVFVKALLYRLAGMHYRPPLCHGTLSTSVPKKDAERTEFIPVRWNGDKVEPVSYHGSSHLNALGDADGLLQLNVGSTGFETGARVHVRHIRT
jgi:molybdopterin molybdotransferase